MDTIVSAIRDRIKASPDKTVLKYKKDGVYVDVSWRKFGEITKLASCALMAMGVNIKDRVGILSENRPEWAYADIAILACGAITVPIYATDTAKDIEYILKDSGAEVIFVSTKDQLEKTLFAAKNVSLRKIIIFDDYDSSDPLVMSFGRFLEHGKKTMPAYMSALSERVRALGPEDIVTIIYTSGSTGPPKGARLCNSNFLSNCRSASEAMSINRADRYLSFLPLSHVFERMAGHYLFLMLGGEIAYAENRDTILKDAKAVSPTIMCGVPRFFEKLYAEILNKAIGSFFIKRNIFFWGYRVGKACLFRKLRKRRIPPYLAVQKYLITDRIAKRLKDSLGGRLRFFASGGAPLSKEVAYFFLSFDILILEGYGLTESSPVISVNTPDNYKIGTGGRPLPGVDVKIAPDGEILAKGPNIMKGYHRLYEDTKSAIKDGWLYTGDIGHIDKDGFLVITDRKKDIIVTSGGKNVAPSEIETAIKADRYIQDILLYGDRKKYLTALIIPDFANLERYAAFKGIEYKKMRELVANQKIYDFIKRRIDAKQIDAPSFTKIKDFIILDSELTQKEGELTPTLKIKRKAVTEKFKDRLDSLYEKDIK